MVRNLTTLIPEWSSGIDRHGGKRRSLSSSGVRVRSPRLAQSRAFSLPLA